MLKRFEISEEQLEKGWKTKKDRKQIKSYLTTFKEFKNIPVYPRSAELFSFCFKGYEHTNGNLYTVKYGYALTAESIEKFVSDNFKDSEDEYLICVSLMSMDYEKYYKNGTFINLDGIDTEMDFWNIEDCDELKKKAQFENEWLQFIIFDINKNAHGEEFKKETE